MPPRGMGRKISSRCRCAICPSSFIRAKAEENAREGNGRRREPLSGLANQYILSGAPELTRNSLPGLASVERARAKRCPLAPARDVGALFVCRAAMRETRVGEHLKDALSAD